ncbi:MAG: nucleoside monophosphate kinase [Candidatus Absconditabacteria bacterium]
MKIIVPIGPPGGGKGTQSTKIAETYGYQHLSTGDIFRSLLKQSKNPLAITVKQITERGDLVPDDIAVQVVKDFLQQQSQLGNKRFILDGFPRTLAQYHISKVLFADYDVHYIYFDVDEEELINRLIERAQKEERADDEKDVITHRLSVYKDLTEPILKELGTSLYTIYSTGKSIEEVWTEVETIVCLI